MFYERRKHPRPHGFRVRFSSTPANNFPRRKEYTLPHAVSQRIPQVKNPLRTATRTRPPLPLAKME